jgi:hypothetical protein
VKNGSAAPNNNKIIVIGCLLLLVVMLCICFLATSAIALSAQNALNNLGDAQRAFERLCDAKPSELELAYSELFTREFKQRTNFEQFSEMYNENLVFFSSCKGRLSRFQLTDIAQGASLSYSKDESSERLSAVLRHEGKTLDLQMVKQEGQWRIEQLYVY